MKYAVTGGLGFIGSNIARELVKKGHKTIIIDNFQTSDKTRIVDIKDTIEFYKIDLRKKTELENNLRGVDGIFHNAALTDVQKSFEEEEKYHSINVEGTKNIFDIATKYEIKVIFASSASVYGDTKSTPINEQFERNPINPYGQTKLENELAAESFAKKGLDVIGLRYFNVYGIGQNKAYAGVITRFLKQLDEGKSPKIFGKGTQVRDFIHVKDVAEANIAAMNSNVKNDFFNIGTGIGTSIIELATMMIKISKQKKNPIFEDAVQGDIESSIANIDHAKNILKWNPKIHLQNGIQELMDNYQMN